MGTDPRVRSTVGGTDSDGGRDIPSGGACSGLRLSSSSILVGNERRLVEPTEEGCVRLLLAVERGTVAVIKPGILLETRPSVDMAVVMGGDTVSLVVGGASLFVGGAINVLTESACVLVSSND